VCGIAGVVSLTPRIRPRPDQLRAMCDRIRHRGPDDYGWQIDGAVGLGMRRLAIIDPAGGQQPVYNEDRSIRAVFNGEIYNYRDLRRGLEAKGHRFRSNADTEVIPHLWEEYGPDFVQRLNGMFAIALHDARANRFVLVRDHLGIKPVFYALDNERLVFGSEIKALLASGLVERELDVDALGEFIGWEYVPAPRTLFRDIRKLEPGHLLEFNLATGIARCDCYWDVPLAPAKEPQEGLTDAGWAELVDATIGRAVKAQLVSDVPLGAFLSGGVDSSLVAAHMGSAQAFSIGFDDPSYNELPWAQRVARHLGLALDFEIIAPRAIELFSSLMDAMDDPIGDFSIFPTHLISRHAREHVTVALSGDGGDELFGGYETFLAEGRARLWQRLPVSLRQSILEPIIARLPPTSQKKGMINKARRFVEGLEHDPDLMHTRWRLFVGEALRQQLFTPAALAAMPTEVGAHIRRHAKRAIACDEVDRMLYVELKTYLVDNCLVKVDRMSMTASLEARVPLLDKELVELAFRVPSRLKVTRRDTKALLKRIAAQHVPADCAYRPKEGFSIPIKQWLKAELRPIMEELLAERHLAVGGLFKPEVVARLKAEHLAGRANHSHVLWALIVFQDWRRRWRT
jgi:asparagine synthase (glutamine-hydrolysing)